MNKFLCSAAVFSLLLFSCSKDEATQVKPQQNPSSIAQTSSANNAIDGQYIVQLKENYFGNALSGALNYESKIKAAQNVLRPILVALPNSGSVEVLNIYVSAINGFAAKLTPAQVDVLSKLPFVVSIDQNSIGNLVGEQSVNAAQAQPEQYGVLRTGRGDGTGKRAFILDSGIDLDHDDLNVNTDLGKDFTADGGLFGGGGGLFGGGGGLFGGGGSSGPEGDDDNGHGTHCAGIVAALDNEIGVVGVAAGAEVVAVKVADFLGRLNATDVLQGIDYVAEVGSQGDAVNMSFTFIGSNATMNDAISNLSDLGIYCAIAAGNNSANANGYYPANINATNVFTVSAMDANDNFASFSNFGNPPVDFCAPGVDVYSTYTNNGYSTLSGTSMAAPHVAGLLLLTNGNLQTDGTVNNDPDGNADPIAHL